MMNLNLNNSNHTFVIAEAGSNWKCGSYDEDLERAEKLIHVAAEAGADAVKFQTFRSELVYAYNSGKSDYLAEHGIKQDINEIFDFLSMPYEMVPELSSLCKKYGILFMSTPFSVQDAKQIDPHVQLHKVASYELNHVRLLEFLATTKKPMLLSTGASTFTDIDFAVNLLRKHNVDDITLMQCTAKYPAPLESLNLAVIPSLRSRYDVSVGLSDHSIDPIIGPLVAIGYGATVIEKHFTLDRSLPGPDHVFAITPKELKLMVETIRNADKTKGDEKKKILPEEKELKQFATRSVQATKNISKDEILIEGQNFDVLRPGSRRRGAEAKLLEEINKKRSSANVEKGDGIVDYY